jgi:hypothetical protein
MKQDIRRLLYVHCYELYVKVQLNCVIQAFYAPSLNCRCIGVVFEIAADKEQLHSEDINAGLDKTDNILITCLTGQITIENHNEQKNPVGSGTTIAVCSCIMIGAGSFSPFRSCR